MCLFGTDPKTKEWLKKSIEPTFGYPNIARFSWATVKVALDKDAHAVQWWVAFSTSSLHSNVTHWFDLSDRVDEGQTNLMKAFESVGAREKGRSSLAKDIGLRSVGDI